MNYVIRYGNQIVAKATLADVMKSGNIGSFSAEGIPLVKKDRRKLVFRVKIEIKKVGNSPTLLLLNELFE